MRECIFASVGDSKHRVGTTTRTLISGTSDIKLVYKLYRGDYWYSL